MNNETNEQRARAIDLEKLQDAVDWIKAQTAPAQESES